MCKDLRVQKVRNEEEITGNVELLHAFERIFQTHLSHTFTSEG